MNPGLKMIVSSIHNPYVEGFHKFLANLCTVKMGLGFAYHFNTILSMLSISCIAIYQGDYYRQKITGAMNLMRMPYVLSIDEIIRKEKPLIADVLSGKLENDDVVEELYRSMVAAYRDAYKHIRKKISS